METPALIPRPERTLTEDDRLLGLLPEPEELFVEMVAGDLVQGTERLVHQQQFGLERQRAGDRDALLHAAGKLPRELALEAGQIDQFQMMLGALLPLGRAHAHDLERQGDVAQHAAPRVKRRGLEDVAVSARQARPLGRDAVDRDDALGRFFEVGDDAHQRRLAAARWPDQRDEVAVADLEIDVGQRVDRCIGGLEGQVEAGDIDDDAPLVHRVLIGGSALRRLGHPSRPVAVRRLNRPGPPSRGWRAAARHSPPSPTRAWRPRPRCG